MPVAHLKERGVVKVFGEAAHDFLQGILTCDLDRVAEGKARFGALLTPQGKILFDFILYRQGSDYLFDIARNIAPDFVKRLNFYKLRAKVTVEDLSDACHVLAGWDCAPVGPVFSPDPRLPALGWRAITEMPLSDTGEDDYHARRIALGVPEGGRDFVWGDVFPHEAGMDLLAGVDFDKGCYVGQEVVSRMQHRGTARTRPVIVLSGDTDLPAATPLLAQEKSIGTTGPGLSGRAVALARLDRIADALEAGVPVTAAGHAVTLRRPDWAHYPFPETAS